MAKLGLAQHVQTLVRKVEGTFSHVVDVPTILPRGIREGTVQHDGNRRGVTLQEQIKEAPIEEPRLVLHGVVNAVR